MFRAFICSGPESDHNTVFNYIPACTRAEQQANNVFFIHCRAIWNITHQSRHSSSPPAAGGLGFISILLFFSCAEIPAGTAGGKVNGQSLLREGNKGQFPVVQDEKKHWNSLAWPTFNIQFSDFAVSRLSHNLLSGGKNDDTIHTSDLCLGMQGQAGI